MYVFNNFYLVKVIAVFARELSTMLRVYYYVVYTKFIEGMFSKFFSRDSKLQRCLCVSYVVFRAYIINYLQSNLPALYF